MCLCQSEDEYRLCRINNELSRHEHSLSQTKETRKVRGKIVVLSEANIQSEPQKDYSVSKTNSNFFSSLRKRKKLKQIKLSQNAFNLILFSKEIEIEANSKSPFPNKYQLYLEGLTKKSHKYKQHLCCQAQSNIEKIDKELKTVKRSKETIKKQSIDNQMNTHQEKKKQNLGDSDNDTIIKSLSDWLYPIMKKIEVYNQKNKLLFEDNAINLLATEYDTYYQRVTKKQKANEPIQHIEQKKQEHKQDKESDHFSTFIKSLITKINQDKEDLKMNDYKSQPFFIRSNSMDSIPIQDLITLSEQNKKGMKDRSKSAIHLRNKIKGSRFYDPFNQKISIKHLFLQLMANKAIPSAIGKNIQRLLLKEIRSPSIGFFKKKLKQNPSTSLSGEMPFDYKIESKTNGLIINRQRNQYQYQVGQKISKEMGREGYLNQRIISNGLDKHIDIETNSNTQSSKYLTTTTKRFLNNHDQSRNEEMPSIKMNDEKGSSVHDNRNKEKERSSKPIKTNSNTHLRMNLNLKEKQLKLSSTNTRIKLTQNTTQTSGKLLLNNQSRNINQRGEETQLKKKTTSHKTKAKKKKKKKEMNADLIVIAETATNQIQLSQSKTNSAFFQGKTSNSLSSPLLRESSNQLNQKQSSQLICSINDQQSERKDNLIDNSAEQTPQPKDITQSAISNSNKEAIVGKNNSNVLSQLSLSNNDLKHIQQMTHPIDNKEYSVNITNAIKQQQQYQPYSIVNNVKSPSIRTKYSKKSNLNLYQAFKPLMRMNALSFDNKEEDCFLYSREVKRKTVLVSQDSEANAINKKVIMRLKKKLDTLQEKEKQNEIISNAQASCQRNIDEININLKEERLNNFIFALNRYRNKQKAIHQMMEKRSKAVSPSF